MSKLILCGWPSSEQCLGGWAYAWARPGQTKLNGPDRPDQKQASKCFPINFQFCYLRVQLHAGPEARTCRAPESHGSVSERTATVASVWPLRSICVTQAAVAWPAHRYAPLPGRQ